MERSGSSVVICAPAGWVEYCCHCSNNTKGKIRTLTVTGSSSCSVFIIYIFFICACLCLCILHRVVTVVLLLVSVPLAATPGPLHSSQLVKHAHNKPGALRRNRGGCMVGN